MLDSGEIIEEYPDDGPYPSCLIFGRTQEGRPLHVVCAPVMDEGRLIIITVYRQIPRDGKLIGGGGNSDDMCHL